MMENNAAVSERSRLCRSHGLILFPKRASARDHPLPETLLLRTWMYTIMPNGSLLCPESHFIQNDGSHVQIEPSW